MVIFSIGSLDLSGNILIRHVSANLISSHRLRSFLQPFVKDYDT